MIVLSLRVVTQVFWLLTKLIGGQRCSTIFFLHILGEQLMNVRRGDWG